MRRWERRWETVEERDQIENHTSTIEIDSTNKSGICFIRKNDEFSPFQVTICDQDLRIIGQDFSLVKPEISMFSLIGCSVSLMHEGHETFIRVKHPFRPSLDLQGNLDFENMIWREMIESTISSLDDQFCFDGMGKLVSDYQIREHCGNEVEDEEEVYVVYNGKKLCLYSNFETLSNKRSISLHKPGISIHPLSTTPSPSSTSPESTNPPPSPSIESLIMISSSFPLLDDEMVVDGGGDVIIETTSTNPLTPPPINSDTDTDTNMTSFTSNGSGGGGGRYKMIIRCEDEREVVRWLSKISHLKDHQPNNNNNNNNNNSSLSSPPLSNFNLSQHSTRNPEFIHGGGDGRDNRKSEEEKKEEEEEEMKMVDDDDEMFDDVPLSPLTCEGRLMIKGDGKRWLGGRKWKETKCSIRNSGEREISFFKQRRIKNFIFSFSFCLFLVILFNK